MRHFEYVNEYLSTYERKMHMNQLLTKKPSKRHMHISDLKVVQENMAMSFSTLLTEKHV